MSHLDEQLRADLAQADLRTLELTFLVRERLVRGFVLRAAQTLQVRMPQRLLGRDAVSRVEFLQLASRGAAIKGEVKRVL